MARVGEVCVCVCVLPVSAGNLRKDKKNKWWQILWKKGGNAQGREGCRGEKRELSVEMVPRGRAAPAPFPPLF